MSTKDAMSVMSQRHRPHKVWRRRYSKLMVVGDAGLGKTTLIRTLLSVPGQKIEMHDGTETNIEQFCRDPDSLCSCITWEDTDDRVVWVYKVQDTPGYGDKLNIWANINAMVEFVVKQNETWLKMETCKKRPADMSTIEDPRIDVCLFCLPPHRLRYIDVMFMKELGKVVPIIPVVTKADTMNIREATMYRQEVYSKLRNPSQVGVRGRINLFEFEKETLKRAGVDASAAQFQTLPFLVVASNDVNADMMTKDNIFWPERQYAWGTCEAFNPDHSDVLQLRLLLLKDGLEEVSAAKLERYEVWRRRRLSAIKFSMHMKLVVLAATAVAAFSIGTSIAQGNTLRGLLGNAWRSTVQTLLFWRRRRNRHILKGASEPALRRSKHALFG